MKWEKNQSQAEGGHKQGDPQRHLHQSDGMRYNTKERTQLEVPPPQLPSNHAPHPTQQRATPNSQPEREREEGEGGRGSLKTFLTFPTPPTPRPAWLQRWSAWFETARCLRCAGGRRLTRCAADEGRRRAACTCTPWVLQRGCGEGGRGLEIVGSFWRLGDPASRLRRFVKR